MREGDEVVHEEDIPEPPGVEVRCRVDAKTKEHVVSWKPVGRIREGEELWYLVHYQERDGSWRGVAPRTADTEIRIPWRLLGRRRSVPVRVLATSGIATGVGECTLEIDEPVRDETTIAVLEPTGPSTVVGVGVLDGWGASIPDPDVTWFDEAGREVGRGKTLDVTSLSDGADVVYAVSRSESSRPATAQVKVARDDTGRCIGCEVVTTPMGRDVHSHNEGGPAPKKAR